MNFTTYNAAYDNARTQADALQRPVGIERANWYGRETFIVHMLPKDPAQRFGCELRWEVVEPGSPRCDKATTDDGKADLLAEGRF